MISTIKNNIARVGGLSALLLPFVALAQDQPRLDYFDSLVIQLNNLATPVSALLISIAVLVFFVGVIRYVTAGDNEERRGAARSLMIYGIIAIFVIVSIWGLVRLLQNITGVDGGGSIDYPTL